MTKAKQEEVFGWTVERINDNRVIVTKGDESHDVRSQDLSGDALVQYAVMQRINAPQPRPDGVVFDVPTATSGATGTEE